jgi:hypothetical protein
MTRNRIATAIALLLMLTIAVTLVAVPLANAHTPPWTIETYAYIEAQPNPIGVGQTAYLTFWIDKVPPTAAGLLYGGRWHNMKLTVTTPNGDTENLGTFNSDATGGAWTQYVPDEVGVYTFKFEFPDQVAQEENPYPYFNANVNAGRAFNNDTFKASSASTTLTVQVAQIEPVYPANPLPTEYWTRPINSMNREWYVLGGDWLGLGGGQFGNTGLYDASNGGRTGGNFNPYTTAPNSAHVLWTKPIAFGGQIGGEFGSEETGLYATGTAYENKFGGVIISGILYYTQFPGAANNMGPLTAVDLRTGETLWTVNASNPLRCGMVYNFNDGNQYGGHAYLFTAPSNYGLGFIVGATPNVFSMYEAMTGKWILDIANVTAGMLVRGENGELLSYRAAGGRLSLWNVSKCIRVASEAIHTYASYSAPEIWRPPQGATIDWNNGYEWNVPIANNISGNAINLGLQKVVDDIALVTQEAPTLAGYSQSGWRVDAAYSAADGHLLWGPINRTLTPFTNKPLGPAAEGVYTEYTCQTMTWIGYSLKTGGKLWGPTKPYNNSWGYFDNNAHGVIGYGNLYAWGMSGEVHCYDVQTGEEKWSWNTGEAGVDTPYGIWPLGTWSMQHLLADGKIYVRAGHDYTPPVFKGAKLYCINATTGEEIWSSLSFNIISSPAAADGIMVWFNGYDNQIYGYGKGPSATTVSAPEISQPLGTAIQVKGTVTDISPGTEEYAQTARFPNGVPAIADESQSAWMEYLYQQQPLPTNAKGVDVIVEVFDPNSNYYEVGRTTSDASGFFKLKFKPNVPGEYTIVARFPGSESYYSSYAETSINVEEAPAATPEPTQAPASLADQYLLPSVGGIIAAIAIVGAIIVLMLRRK